MQAALFYYRDTTATKAFCTLTARGDVYKVSLVQLYFLVSCLGTSATAYILVNIYIPITEGAYT